MEMSLEDTIKFCMVNQVLMQLTYNSETRLVEPYSFKMPKNGNYLMYGYCYKDNRINSFSMAKITDVVATPDKFVPRWAIQP